MTSTIKFKAAEALFPLLSAFHEVDGLLLDSVRIAKTYEMTTQIALQFDSRFLVIGTEAEDDTAELTLQTATPAGELANEDQPWEAFIGKPVGWGWVMMNQQGYLDGILLSFGGVIPEILIVVVASSLQVKKVG